MTVDIAGEESCAASGKKNDDGKPPISLLDRDFIEGTANVMAFGAKKYDPKALESPQRFVLYPLNPLFDPFVISPQHPYSPYDRGVPLELSPHTSQIPPCQVFPLMDSEGEIPTSPRGPPDVSTRHTPNVDNESEYDFPPEGFPYVGRVPSQPPAYNSGPMLPHGYTTLAQLVSINPSASSLYQNPILSSNAMPISGSFIPNVTSQIPMQIVFASVLIQPMIL